MIKLLVRLAAAALITNALYRVGSEYLTLIRFRDRIRAAATSRARSDEDLRRRIVALADEYDIPLDRADLTIARDHDQVTVNTHYRKPIELLPRYPVSWPFDVSLRVETVEMQLLPGAPPQRDH